MATEWKERFSPKASSCGLLTCLWHSSGTSLPAMIYRNVRNVDFFSAYNITVHRNPSQESHRSKLSLHSLNTTMTLFAWLREKKHLFCCWVKLIKVPMKWNLFVLIWKAFQNREEWRFSFWNIFFRLRDIDIFLLCKLDQWWRHMVCN